MLRLAKRGRFAKVSRWLKSMAWGLLKILYIGKEGRKNQKALFV